MRCLTATNTINVHIFNALQERCTVLVRPAGTPIEVHCQPRTGGGVRRQSRNRLQRSSKCFAIAPRCDAGAPARKCHHSDLGRRSPRKTSESQSGRPARSSSGTGIGPVVALNANENENGLGCKAAAKAARALRGQVTAARMVKHSASGHPATRVLRIGTMTARGHSRYASMP